MKSGYKKLLTAAAAALSLASPVLTNAALAAPSFYAQGVALYSAGKYGQALPVLEAAAKASPYDSSTHYYLGLCLMALKQSGQARRQFEWVAQNAADPTLKSYASSALAAIPAGGAAHASGTGSGSTAPAARPTDFSAPQAVASTQPKKLGRCKVLMFETSWCHYCHEFAPHFDEVANKYRGSMDFQRVDAEQDIGLKEKYGIHSYPRLVYLDGSGNVLYNEGRGEFDNRIQELTAK
ncbi:MAG: hypothetical protein JST01_15575 [Cyanobacteria bacterium SZAS TMP-1]|nr:hypothetical protein [Cyanobacteria bacterium SZAS TMP-1]